ncbi:MAG: acetate--CoA ligase family protein, partial [Gemmatimonadales bacterium]
MPHPPAAGEGRWLTEPDALRLLADYHLPVIAYRMATTPEAAAQAARDLGCPVALKVVASEIVHKSDIGGVILNIPTPGE